MMDILKALWIPFDWMIRSFVGAGIALAFLIWGAIDILSSYCRYGHIYSSDQKLVAYSLAIASGLAFCGYIRRAK